MNKIVLGQGFFYYLNTSQTSLIGVRGLLKKLHVLAAVTILINVRTLELFFPGFIISTLSAYFYSPLFKKIMKVTSKLEEPIL